MDRPLQGGAFSLAGLQYLLLMAIVVSLPFFEQLTSYLILACVVLSLVKGQYKLQWKRLRRRPLAGLWVILFGLYAASFLYSDFELHLLERKMSFFVLPLLMASIRLSKKQLQYICWGFAASVTLASLVTFGVSLAEAWSLKSAEPLFYQELTEPIGMNAIYMAYYICFSMLIGMHWGFLNWSSLKIQWRTGVVIYLIWSLIFLAFLSSKAFLLIAFLLMNLYFYQFLKRSDSRRWIGVQLGANALLILFIMSLPITRERIMNVVDTDLGVVTQDRFEYDTDFSGLSLRLVMGRATVDILDRNHAWLLGVGAGDVQEELDRQYSAYNLYTGNPQLGDKGYLGYNAHNQFLQILLATGLIGLVAWLMILLFPIYRAFKKRRLLLFSFLFMSLLFACTESFLERHHGVVFFLFFYGLLLFSRKDNSI